MYRRNISEEKLKDLAGAPELNRRQNATSLSSIEPHLLEEDENDSGDPYYETPFGRLAGSRNNTDILSAFAGGPKGYLQKTTPDIRQLIMGDVLARDTPVVLETAGRELISAHEPGGRYIPMRAVVTAMTSVLGPDATVIDRGFFPQNGALWLNAVVLDVPPGAQGVYEGGDFGVTLTEEGRAPQVGDLTRAGLSVFRQSLKDDVYVRLFLERLFCTNGMTSKIPGAEFRLKGSTAEEIIDQMEAAAHDAFSQGGPAIEQLYALRDHPVRGDVTQYVARVADDLGLPDSRVRSLALRAPELMRESGAPPSMFDVVNLITNEANAPDLQPPARRALMHAGASLAAEHRGRCVSCSQVL
jgi:hypothetical protein